VRTAQFGDGYQQRTADGINHIVRQWSVEFTLIKEEADTLINFFQGLGGVTNFKWQPPTDDIELSFVCDSWSYNRIVSNSRVMQINANFNQVYEA